MGNQTDTEVVEKVGFWYADWSFPIFTALLAS